MFFSGTAFTVLSKMNEYSLTTLRKTQLATLSSSLASLTLPVHCLNFAAGSAAGFSTDVIFYGLDSLKTQQQQQQQKAAINIRRLFRGMFPLSIAGTVPSFGIFFAIYETSKDALQRKFGINNTFACSIAALLAGIPSSLAAVPSDVIKKRIVLGHASDPYAAVHQVIHNGGNGARVNLGGLFAGWRANMAKDVPFAVAKLTIFEELVHLYESKVLSSSSSTNWVERVSIGAASGVVTAVLTNPLDVINTRIKGSKVIETKRNMWSIGREIVVREGASKLFAGLQYRAIILGLGSGVFWGCHAACKSALGLAPTTFH